jgi:hypothetical protein
MVLGAWGKKRNRETLIGGQDESLIFHRLPDALDFKQTNLD